MDIDKIKLSLSLEGVYSSNMRNCFVLFTLGLTIINLSKKKYKFLFALLLICGAVLLGITSTYEFNKNISLVKNNKFKEYKIKTNNYYIFIYAILLLALIFLYRFMLMNQKHEFLKQ